MQEYCDCVVWNKESQKKYANNDLSMMPLLNLFDFIKLGILSELLGEDTQ